MRATKKKPTIATVAAEAGVAVDTTEDPWFTQLLTGIEEELATRDTSLMLASLELRGHYDARIVLDWIRGRRIDGLIVPKSSRRERPLLQAAAAERRIPDGTDHAGEHGAASTMLNVEC